MDCVWQLQQAKNRLSEVVDAAIHNGPQVITRRGAETAVVLSYADYGKLLVDRGSLTDFFRNSPLVGVDLDLSRDESPITNPWRA